MEWVDGGGRVRKVWGEIRNIIPSPDKSGTSLLKKGRFIESGGLRVDMKFDKASHLSIL